MGGAIAFPGNITPVGEFNAIADAHAAARVFALTSPDPASTMPPTPPHNPNHHPLHPYPPKATLGPRRLNLTLFPLDLTTAITIARSQLHSKTHPLVAQGSPLAEWTTAFLEATFQKLESLGEGHQGETTALSLHDPVCVWYALRGDSDPWTIAAAEDIRVETTGQWTRGMCIVDNRQRKKYDGDEGGGGAAVSDSGGWLDRSRGNRLNRCVGTPGNEVLAPLMLGRIFGGGGWRFFFSIYYIR